MRRAAVRAIAHASSAAALLAALAGNISAAEAGGVRVDDAVFDWGRVYRGEVVRHTFTLSNGGESPLLVKEVKVHCSCTEIVGAAHLASIPPGKTVPLTVDIDTTTLTGTVKKDVDVIDETGAEARVSVQGEVVEILKLDPALPKVERVRGAFAPPEPTKVIVVPDARERVTLKGVRALDGVLSATLREVPGGGSYEISLLPSSENENQDSFQKETLELTAVAGGKHAVAGGKDAVAGGKEIALRVAVSFVLKDRIEVSPSRSVYVPRAATADFGTPGTTVERVLELSSLAGERHRFRVEKAESRGGGFSAGIEPVEVGRRYRLRVTLVRGPEEGERFVRDTIDVTTDDPLVPRISIPAVAQF